MTVSLQRVATRDLTAPGRRVLAALATVLLLSGGVAGDERAIDEPRGEKAKQYAAKAAMLVKIVKYIEWPETSFPKRDTPLVVGILGTDPFRHRLDRLLLGERYKGHPIQVKRYMRPTAGIEEAHILFVPAERACCLKLVMERLAGQNVLLVGESARFAELGGALGFYRHKKALRFEVNPGAAKRAGLKISSSLLKLARIVEGPKKRR